MKEFTDITLKARSGNADTWGRRLRLTCEELDMSTWRGANS